MNQIMHHPKHGAKIATHEQEIKNDEKEGWVRYNPSTPSVIEAAPVNQLEVKRGRPRKELQ